MLFVRICFHAGENVILPNESNTSTQPNTEHEASTQKKNFSYLLIDF
jgi:hypothetical protein